MSGSRSTGALVGLNGTGHGKGLAADENCNADACEGSAQILGQSQWGLPPWTGESSSSPSPACEDSVTEYEFVINEPGFESFCSRTLL